VVDTKRIIRKNGEQGVADQKSCLKPRKNIFFCCLKAQLGLASPFTNAPILGPIVGFESIMDFGVESGYIVITDDAFQFPKHGLSVPRVCIQKPFVICLD
jgi:hypothetical protein